MGNCFSSKKTLADQEDSPRTNSPSMSIVTKETTPFEGQKPGTSGILPNQSTSNRRFEKESKDFHAEELHRELCASIPPHKDEPIKAILEAIPSPGAKGATLVIGGDGRYYNKEVMQIIAKMAAANGVRYVLYRC